MKNFYKVLLICLEKVTHYLHSIHKNNWKVYKFLEIYTNRVRKKYHNYY